MSKTLPVKNMDDLLLSIENNETIFGIKFFDLENKLIVSYKNEEEPKGDDSTAIKRLVAELAKAKNDEAFIRAFGKREHPIFKGQYIRDPEAPLDVSAIEFCFFHKNNKDIVGNKPYQWYRVIVGDLILRILDTEDPEDVKCLIEVLHPSEESHVKKIKTQKGSPDVVVIKKLFLKLDLSRKASCSEVLLTFERCWDASTKKTQEHFAGFIDEL